MGEMQQAQGELRISSPREHSTPLPCLPPPPPPPPPPPFPPVCFKPQLSTGSVTISRRFLYLLLQPPPPLMCGQTTGDRNPAMKRKTACSSSLSNPTSVCPNRPRWNPALKCCYQVTCRCSCVAFVMHSFVYQRAQKRDKIFLRTKCLRFSLSMLRANVTRHTPHVRYGSSATVDSIATSTQAR
jgi:hypothetical protein